MKPKVYVETTVISYLAAPPSRDVVVAGHQHITREWWETCRDKFEMVGSQLVVQEAGAGDEEAARRKLALLDEITLLEVTDDALALARDLVDAWAIPGQAAEDALHIAVAAAHGVDYLITWDCRDIGNATMRALIEEVCRSAGHDPAIICTPEELLEVE